MTSQAPHRCKKPIISVSSYSAQHRLSNTDKTFRSIVTQQTLPLSPPPPFSPSLYHGGGTSLHPKVTKLLIEPENENNLTLTGFEPIIFAILMTDSRQVISLRHGYRSDKFIK